MRKPVIATLIVAAVGVSFFVGNRVAARAPASAPTADACVEKVHDYCALVRASLLLKAKTFANAQLSGAFREASAHELMQQDLYMNGAALQLCASKPVDISRASGCFVGLDYACLAAIANDAVVAIPQ
jgi:hypothetical protein